MIVEAGFNPIDLKPKAPITRLRAFHDGTAALTTVNSCRADMDYCVKIAREVTGTEAMASADRRPSALLRKDHTMFRNLLTSLTLAAATSIPLASSAVAGIGDGAALGAPSLVTQPPYVEEAQFIYGGYHYCWYPAGWHGPGWYRCGWGWRTGFGWGGGVGWNGWAWRGGWHHWGWHH